MTGRFHVGDAVRARPTRAPGHTRLPRYLSGHAGTIERVHGLVPVADHRAMGRDAAPETLYTVVFEASEVWPGEGAPFTICADLWESYLQPDTP